ncbi:MAG TPA: hypothetical protein VI564_04125 [Candidatus Nanoarchaeia archaeon]|nr:hypothetical protein [Candidatus Nanoarchaeia archaeon]
MAETIYYSKIPKDETCLSDRLRQISKTFGMLEAVVIKPSGQCWVLRVDSIGEGHGGYALNVDQKTFRGYSSVPLSPESDEVMEYISRTKLIFYIDESQFSGFKDTYKAKGLTLKELN